MILLGKHKKKRARALRRAATQFIWQTYLSLLGEFAFNGTRSRSSAVLRRHSSATLDQAEWIIRRGLAADPLNVDLAIEHAELAMARGHWHEATRRWRFVQDRSNGSLSPDLASRMHFALLKSGNVEDVAPGEDTATAAELYRSWCEEQDALSDDDIAAARATVEKWPSRPLISVLMPCYNAAPGMLVTAIESVLSQAYPYWELCIVDDASDDPAVASVLEGYSARDRRIRVGSRKERGHISRAANGALAMAQGEFCFLLDHDDALAPQALLFVAGEIVRNPDVDWLYFDADHIDEAELRHGPLFRSKPDPEMGVVLPYLGTHAVYRRRVLLDAGGMRAGYEGAQDHDLALRLLEIVPQPRIRHIPSVLYHRRSHPQSTTGSFLQKPYAPVSAEKAIADCLVRRKATAEVSELHSCTGFRVRYHLPQPPPLVSLIIPTRDGLHLLRPCIESLRERTRYPAMEIIIVDNGSSNPAALRYLDHLESHCDVRVIRVPEPFNWSRLNNIAVREARGSLLCLLNNDVEAVNEGWLEEMVAQASRPEVGVVGAALWFPEGRMQHGGIVFEPRSGVPSHAMSGIWRAERPARARVVQSVSAVTGACMVMRRDVYLAAGGMDEAALPVGYNDVDFCFRVAHDLGLRCLWTPHAELLHKESASRGRLVTHADRVRHVRDRRLLLNRWYEFMVSDPCFQPTVGGKTPLESAYPGSQVRLNRYLVAPSVRVAFVHIPKTAGVSMRNNLLDALPSPSTMAISAQTTLRCYEGDPLALSRLKRTLRDVVVLLSHFSYGFGDLLDWPCAYATILRDPLARTVSHYRHVFLQPHTPFKDTAIGSAPMQTLLRKGAIAGNLMLRKILGEAPEAVTWREINAGCPAASGFAGFRLPPQLWARRYEELLDGPDLEPDSDLSKVDTALDIIERKFAFVGRAEALESQAQVFLSALGIRRTVELAHLNAGADVAVDLTPQDREAAEAYNQLDRALYQRIAQMQGGLLLNGRKLRPRELPELAAVAAS